MEAIDCILSRRSVPRLRPPGPSGEEVNTLIQCALRAPDHKYLEPWHFYITQGEEALRKLGQSWAEAIASMPGVSSKHLDKVRSMPLRAPLLVTVTSKSIAHPKVPFLEQKLSAGAAAQNIILAAHALGYGAIWRTGELAWLPAIRGSMGITGEETIVGFLYIGSADSKVGPPPERKPEDFITWL